MELLQAGSRSGMSTSAGAALQDNGSATVSDEALAARCLAGDQSSWTELIHRYTRPVYFLALRSAGGRRHEAEDLCQDIFLKVSTILDRYDRSCTFKPWLLQVARNFLIDHHRSRRREKESTLELDAMVVEPGSRPATQGAAVLQRERAEAISRGLDRLPESLREAVTLRDLQELEYEEISTMLSVPLGTVKSRINRGRIRLAELLTAERAELA
jgi:RNA polymerase sigma-70 factor (ECF subfamily)